MKHIYLSVFLLFIFYQQSESLQCFACTVANSESDQTCITDPAKVPGSIIKCEKKYCTSLRQEFKDPPDQVNSFYRGCEENPAKMNTEVEDNEFIYYYRSCTSDLCNSGIGKDANTNGPNGIDDDGEGVLRVPGSNALGNVANTFVLLSGLLYIFVIKYIIL